LSPVQRPGVNAWKPARGGLAASQNDGLALLGAAEEEQAAAQTTAAL
jgi:hypothetical protein